MRYQFLCLVLGLGLLESPLLAQRLSLLEKELKVFFEGYYANTQDLENLRVEEGSSALLQPAMSTIQRFRRQDKEALWYLYSRFYLHNPDKPLVQFIHRFSLSEGKYLVEHYEFSPSVQKSFTQAWRNIKIMDKLKPEDLLLQKDCALHWLAVEGESQETYEIRQIQASCPFLQGRGHPSHFWVRVLFNREFFKSETLYFGIDGQEIPMPAVPRYHRCTKAEARRILKRYKTAKTNPQ